MIPENKKSSFRFLLTFFIFLVISVSFYNFYFKKDFISYDFLPCSPTDNNCFVLQCEQGDVRCEWYKREDGLYYFYIVKQTKFSKDIIHCNLENLEKFSNFLFGAKCS